MRIKQMTSLKKYYRILALTLALTLLIVSSPFTTVNADSGDSLNFETKASSFTFEEINIPNIELYGTAYQQDDEIILTGDAKNQGGMALLDAKLSELNSVIVEFDIYLGDKNGEAADGMSVTFDPNINTNIPDGYRVGLNNGSVGVCYTTYTRTTIQKIKIVEDYSFWERQVYEPENYLDDGQWHNTKVMYYKDSMSVIFDGEQILNYSGIREITEGYISIRGTTGSLHNIQKIRNIKVVKIIADDNNENPDENPEPTTQPTSFFDNENFIFEEINLPPLIIAGDQLNTFPPEDAGETFTLTDGASQGGMILLGDKKFNNINSMIFEFDLYLGDGNGSGADGISVIFDPERNDDIPAGDKVGVNNGAVGICYTTCTENRTQKIKIVEDSASAEKQSFVPENYLDNGQWHSTKIMYYGNRMSVIFDGNRILDYAGIREIEEGYISIRATTGVLQNVQKVKNIKLSRIKYKVPVFHSDAGIDIPISYNWDCSMFEQDNKVYNHDLAKVACLLSNDVYKKGRATYRLMELGCDSNTISFVRYSDSDDFLNPNRVFGSLKYADEHGVLKTLVIVAISGTNSLGTVATDILDGGFYGFINSGKNARDDLLKYCEYMKIDLYNSNTRLFITGHSLGGAVANRVAVELQNDGIKAIPYVYTFAAARNTVQPQWSVFNNWNAIYAEFNYPYVHNIVNINDLVPQLPPYGVRIGKDYIYDANAQKYATERQIAWGTAGDIDEFMYNHLLTTYWYCLQTEEPEEANIILEYWRYGFYKWANILHVVRCPVEVEVTDKNGTILCYSQDGKAFNAENDLAYIMVDGEDKYVFVNREKKDEVEISVKGVDHGAMDYTVQDFDGNNVITKEYNNISVEEGKEFNAEGWEKSALNTSLIVMEENKPVAEVQNDGTEISFSDHVIVEDPFVAPTCTDAGMTAGTHCADCNLIIKQQEIIPATGHQFGEWTEEDGVMIRICNQCGESETREIGWEKLLGATLSLQGDIGLNIYLQIDDEVANNPNAYVSVTYPDSTVKKIAIVDAKRTLSAEGYCYVIQCNVASKEMNSNIYIQVVSPNEAGDQYGKVHKYSVREYAEYLLNHIYDEHGNIINEEYYQAEELVRAMLVYGDLSQIYFNYCTDEIYKNDAELLREAQVKIANLPVDTIGHEYDIHSEKLFPGLKFAGASLDLQSKTTMNLYFLNSTTYELDYTDSSGNSLLQSQLDGYTVVKVENIDAKSLDDDMRINIHIAGNDDEYYVYSCPMTYCHMVLAKETSEMYNTALKNVLKALYFYNIAANVYFGD